MLMVCLTCFESFIYINQPLKNTHTVHTAVAVTQLGLMLMVLCTGIIDYD